MLNWRESQNFATSAQTRVLAWRNASHFAASMLSRSIVTGAPWPSTLKMKRGIVRLQTDRSGQSAGLVAGGSYSALKLGQERRSAKRVNAEKLGAILFLPTLQGSPDDQWAARRAPVAGRFHCAPIESPRNARSTGSLCPRRELLLLIEIFAASSHGPGRPLVSLAPMMAKHELPLRIVTLMSGVSAVTFLGLVEIHKLLF